MKPIVEPDAEKLIGNSKPLLLIGSPIDSGGVGRGANSGGSAPGIHL